MQLRTQGMGSAPAGWTAASGGVDRWAELVREGIEKAVAGLSDMVGREVAVTSFDPRQGDAGYVHALLGGPEQLIVGVYVGVRGAAPGTLLLAFPQQVGYELIDMLMGQPAGATTGLDEMGESVLGEMGNLMGAFFLSLLGDSTNGQLLPTPPVIVNDMAGSVVDAALAQMMLEMDDILTAATSFGTPDHQIHGVFLVLPSEQLMSLALSERAAA